MSQNFYGSGINSVYKEICYALIYNPDYILKPRNLKTAEILNAHIYITDPRKRILTLKSRNISYRYLAGELCFYLSGSRSLKFISHYSKFWNKISDNGRTVNSCYGYKIFKKKVNYITQFEYAEYQLLKDKDTRKAIIMMHTDENNVLKTNDDICTIYLQFFIRHEHLILITYMRSNDIFFGLTYDIPFFTIVQEIMLIHLQEKYPDLTLGSYIHNAGSLHFYEKDYDKVLACSKEGSLFLPSEKMPSITRRTLIEFPLLLKYEKQLRKKGESNIKFLDAFLFTLRCWLEEK